MASTMLDQILDDIKTAMKAQEKDKLMALRLLHSEIKNVGINERRDPTDEDTLNVISRLIKQRQEAIEQFRQGGRDDLIAKDTLQLEIYRSYQPEQMTEDEIAALVDEAIAATGASSKKEMGSVMKILMPQVKGRADGKVVNTIVNQKLG
ncbi:MAG: GatB/YqeY domain-containing protein [Candidatus Tectomicrobia bacterium]|nr:GatB/YqeY domain-containing protein [Candidatus Tectomicrobia bacterium]